jgi:hypothetical protein
MPKFKCHSEYFVARRREAVIEAETQEAAWDEFQRRLDAEEIEPTDSYLNNSEDGGIEQIEK